VLRDVFISLIVVVCREPRGVLKKTLPLFSPVVLIIAIVVIACFRDSDLEEVREMEHRSGRRVASSRMPVYTGSGYIHPLITAGKFLHSGDLVRQCVVTHVSEIRVVKFLRTPWRAHAVDFDNDKTQLGKRLRVAARCEEVARTDTARLRSGVNVVNDGIFLA